MYERMEIMNDIEELKRILEEIDEIEDDEQFCDAERDAFMDYCYDHNFNLNDEVIAMIKDRGLYDSYEAWLEMHYEAMQLETDFH